mmetsp:Transcript_76907/g.204122  ORF Transcript_76907/g.204122 Transcript_76907/m.204122 type:complete len:244 (-) Transcript_76907:46-777(-)
MLGVEAAKEDVRGPSKLVDDIAEQSGHSGLIVAAHLQLLALEKASLAGTEVVEDRPLEAVGEDAHVGVSQKCGTLVLELGQQGLAPGPQTDGPSRLAADGKVRELRGDVRLDPVDHCPRIVVAPLLNRSVRVDLVAERPPDGARVQVARAVRNQDGRVALERVGLSFRDFRELVVGADPGRQTRLGDASREVHGGHLVPASTAAIEVDHELVGVPGPDTEEELTTEQAAGATARVDVRNAALL